MSFQRIFPDLSEAFWSDALWFALSLSTAQQMGGWALSGRQFSLQGLTQVLQREDGSFVQAFQVNW